MAADVSAGNPAVISPGACSPPADSLDAGFGTGQAYPECETVVTAYESGFYYGGYSVAQLGDVDLAPFAPLAGGELVPPGGLLFLDTETTGLSGGAGTVAFLLGTGHFVDGGFIVKQYLMRDYDEEYSLLSGLVSEMGSRGALVTYNGKAFDMNLLAGRFVMNGMRLPRAACHIDLLHPARRMWRRCIENCRLVTIESEILGEPRDEDIPGSQIPQVFFEFLETREWEMMQKVLLHNRLDILAMAALLKYVSDAVGRARGAGPFDASAYPVTDRMSPGRISDRNAEELYGLAGYFYSLKDTDMAELCLRKCVERGKPAATRRALARLAEIKKRGGDYAGAVACWDRLLAFAPRVGLYPYIELAKYYEHKARDPVKAMAYADQARAAAASPVFNNSRERLEVEARRERLMRKIENLKGAVSDEC